MLKWIPCVLLLLLSLACAGCGKSSEAETEPQKLPNSFNNNAPGAANAPAAPMPGPDVPRPGGGVGGKQPHR